MEEPEVNTVFSREIPAHDSWGMNFTEEGEKLYDVFISLEVDDYEPELARLNLPNGGNLNKRECLELAKALNEAALILEDKDE